MRGAGVLPVICTPTLAHDLDDYIRRADDLADLHLIVRNGRNLLQAT
jgi:hypothetical protein